MCRRISESRGKKKRESSRNNKEINDYESSGPHRIMITIIIRERITVEVRERRNKVRSSETRDERKKP